MDTKLHQSINDHLALEFGAAHRYLAMAIWCELNDLQGFAGWLKQQSNEELEHAHRFIDHLMERDLEVVLPTIEAPPTSWDSPTAVVQDALEGEQEVTRAIEGLYDLADTCNDRAALLMLQWFVSEQVEEENLMRGILGRLRLAGDQGTGLLLVDQEVGRGKLQPESPGD